MKISDMKFMKSIITFTIAILLISQCRMLTAHAVGDNGWIEVKVNVPENFSDQIYIQFQETGKVDEAFYENFVQLLPENEYVGRIKLPVGTYEITCKSVYENPLIYNLELDTSTESPITVEGGDVATSVVLNCTVVPIEDLPEIEGKYPQEILDMAQQASDEKGLKGESTENISDDSTSLENVPNPDNSDETEVIEVDPLKNILQGLFSTIIFTVIIGGIGYFIYWSNENRR